MEHMKIKKNTGNFSEYSQIHFWDTFAYRHLFNWTMSYRRKNTFPYPSGRVMHIDPQQVRNTYSCTPIHLSHDVLFKRSQIRIHTCWDTFIMKKQIDLIQGQAFLENPNWWLGISMIVSIQRAIGKCIQNTKCTIHYSQYF